MSGYRVPTETSKYYIPKQRYLTARHFCLQYREWQDEYNSLKTNGLKAIVYTGMPHAANTGDPTAQAAERMEELSRKMKLIQDTVQEVSPELYKWLLKGVTEEDISFDYLKQIMNIPCGERYYYECRQKFFYVLSNKLQWL